MGGFFDKFTYHIVYIKLNVALKELVRPIIIHISHSLYKTELHIIVDYVD